MTTTLCTTLVSNNKEKEIKKESRSSSLLVATKRLWRKSWRKSKGNGSNSNLFRTSEEEEEPILQNYFEWLPSELVRLVFSFTAITDAKALSASSKKFNDFYLEESQQLWKMLVLNTWLQMNIPLTEKMRQPSWPEGYEWKWIAHCFLMNTNSKRSYVEVNVPGCGWASADYYIGNWDNGRICGKAIALFKGGEIFVGEHKDAKRNGKGLMKYPGGDTYQGEFKNGQKDGWGMYTWRDKCFKYEGEWKEGKQHGRGMMIYASGDKYEGAWDKGIKSGQGKYTWMNGITYEGSWKQNKQNGLGTMIYQPSGDVYTGEWKDGKKNGHGVYIWKKDNRRWEGEWKDGVQDYEKTKLMQQTAAKVDVPITKNSLLT